jgi:hypothetical protein
MSQITPQIPAPATPMIDVAILRQFTGQDIVCDPNVAHRQYQSAKAALAEAEKQLKGANRLVQYRRVRYWAACKGIVALAAGLIVGSGAALTLAALVTLTLGPSLGSAFVAAAFAYLVFGGAAFWLIRPLDGETDENRVQVRSDRLHQADYICSAVMRIVHDRAGQADRALILLRSIDQALQSEANKRVVETNRLLGVEAGRLYPDEFERYIADIFRHLGFKVEATGKSGDQGVDVIASRATQRIAIQAKRFSGSVSNSAVQEVYAGMAHYGCSRCVVVSTSNFTQPAIALAQSTGCILIGSDQIATLVRGEIPF